MIPFRQSDVHSFTDVQKTIIDESIQVFRETVRSFNDTRLPMPKQISPWSYKSLECSHDMYKSEFTHWMKERIWDKMFYLINDYKRDLGLFLKNYQESSRPQRYFGRGVVFSTHHRLVTYTLMSISFLRHHGSHLPVEVWYIDIMNFLTLIGMRMNFLLKTF